MAFTVAQLEAIEEAIGSGELSVEFEGKKVQYASIDDLKKRYDFVRGQLVADGTLTDSTPRRSYAVFSRS
jgi:hypothetical protein